MFCITKGTVKIQELNDSLNNRQINSVVLSNCLIVKLYKLFPFNCLLLNCLIDLLPTAELPNNIPLQHTIHRSPLHYSTVNAQGGLVLFNFTTAKLFNSFYLPATFFLFNCKG